MTQPSPYVPGHILGDKSKNVVKFKSKLNNAVPMNGKINFNWKMVVGEQEIVDDDYLPERYEKINEQSKISLDDFEKINKMAPVEIKTNRINDYTDVKNFFIVGTQDNSKDTLVKAMSNTYTGGEYTSINADYRFKKVSFANPRVITYDKEKPNGKITSYTHSYEQDGPGDLDINSGDSQAMGGSGFGFVTVDDQNKIINPSPTSEWWITPDKEKLSSRPLSKIEEVYLSKDKNTMLIYGDYTIREGKSNTGIKIPIVTTLKSVDGLGTGTMSHRLLNSFNETKTFRSYYASHIDINKIHKKSKMRTLGNSDGVYFYEKNLTGLDKDYYLAFYRAQNEAGTGPSSMFVKEYKDKDNIAPDWDVPGNSANAPYFDPSQPKGEEIFLRDANGKLLPGNKSNGHPGFGFLFDGGKVGPGEVVTSELEVKATDFILPDYSSVEIKPEANQKISKKEDLVYKPKFVQELDANMPSEAHRVKTLDVVFDYKPLLENVSSDDFKVLQDDVVIDNTGNKIYDVLINEANKTITVRFKDPFLFNNKYNPAGNKARSHITLVQNSKIRTDSEEIVQYYNKTAGQFEFKIEAFNKFKLDILDSDIVQKNKSKETQIIKYIPRITAVPKTDITVNAGDPAGDPARYLDITYDKDFDFDDYEVSYKDDIVPVFQNDGTQDIFLTVKSKKFGEQDKLTNIKVTVKVTEDLEMSFIHYVTSPTGKNEKIRNLKDPSYPEYKKDPVKINATANFKTELKKYQDEKHLGYDYVKTIVKVDGVEITPTDKVPNKNFVVELYYKGQVILEQPDSFDFGSQKLSAVEQKEVSPKIKKDDSEADDREKMKIINTQGAESGWKLFAKQSIEMTNAGNPLKGRLYYISEDGQSQVTIDKNEKPIKMITSNNKAPFISNVPLLPGSKEQKMGIYLDIYPGNTRGEYSNGEITWELRNAL